MILTLYAFFRRWRYTTIYTLAVGYAAYCVTVFQYMGKWR